MLSQVGVVCHQEWPSCRETASSTNGVSSGRPIWLNDPDLSSLTRAFTAADHLVQSKHGKHETGRAAHCFCSNISAQLVENKVMLIDFLPILHRGPMFLLSVWMTLQRSRVCFSPWNLFLHCCFAMSRVKMRDSCHGISSADLPLMDSEMMRPAVLPPVPSAESSVAPRRATARLPARSASKTSTSPLTSQRLTGPAPVGTTACLHGTSCSPFVTISRNKSR